MQQLIDGDLPKMVRWYDPRLLARVGVRTLISAVFGQYADQRLIQAATDPAVGRDLVERYDYCSPAGGDPAKCVSVDGSGAFWIDYICDIGDGFEATYPMAYLLAQDRLELRGAGALPHGDILIMGGDQCYPQATRPEYRKRLQDPYAFALSGNEPKRKLFAIPGNHDWYDGLQAFDSLFCSSRDRLSESRGNLIGGWQCQQHRSYWALKLPHKWWIWGTDIQFSKYLDIAQINYFMAVAAEMGPDDKLIICMAEPSWMLADFQGQDEEENFFKITAIARMRGAKVCAVLAGDWHHYNRYSSAELGVHFFTAGGGGAFLHPTHVLKNEISVRWPEIRTTTYDNDEHGVVKHEMAAQRYDVRLKRPRKAGSKIEEAVRDVVEPIREIKEEIKEEIKAKVKQKKAEAPLRPRAPKCYPKRSTSLLLSFRNLAFPLLNFPFAIGIGIIYWLITWQFHTVVRAYDISAGKIDQVGLTVAPQTVLAWMPLYMLQATLSMSFAMMLMGLYAALVWYVDAEEKPGLRRILSKIGVGTAHFVAHTTAMFVLFVSFLALNNNIAPLFERHAATVLAGEAAEPGLVGSIMKESLEPLSRERQLQREQADAGPRDVTPPTPPSARQSKAARTIEPRTVREVVGLLYPLEMSVIGGIVGGFIWGCYWVIAGLFGHMHAEDAFAALRIKNYRNFLRMKFEPDQVTIYPVGLDRVPHLTEWTAMNDTVYADGGRSALAPRQPLRPHLIEEPIVIRPDQVKD
jgi:hypothetical protein